MSASGATGSNAPGQAPAIPAGVVNDSRRDVILGQLIQDVRFAIDKFAQGVIIYATLAGVTLTFAASSAAATRRALAIAHLAFGASLVVFGWACAFFVKRTVGSVRELAGDPLKASIESPLWVFFGAALLSVCAAVHYILVWWPNL
jgi:hypothetical protein